MNQQNWPSNQSIEFVPYSRELAPYFEKLNRVWIEQFFYMEEFDKQVLEQPETYILNPGGYILFIKYDGVIAGTVALMPIDDETVEMTKLGVDESLRGKKLGWLLSKRIMEQAAAQGYKKMVLYSNTVLEPAINMYRKLGFKEIKPEGGVHYERCNIIMEIELEPHPLGEEIQNLTMVLDDIYPKLAAMPIDIVKLYPAEGKWSIQQILGHLIDSAINNLPRFILSQWQDRVKVPTYEQNNWVNAQQYQCLEWKQTYELWWRLNQQVLSVWKKLPLESLDKTILIGDREPVNLMFVISDYGAHLQHHLDQIMAIYGNHQSELSAH